jgi:3-hydroxyisobutyrate dehydrogenase
MATIGFIGLGNMGTPMAANLVKAGHAVKGFDLSAEILSAAVKRGVVAAKSTADAVADVEFVVTMLPAGRHVLAVYAEALNAAKPGTLFIESSTIDVASARAAHAMAAEHKMLSVDAPVSGGVGGAEAATLTFMAGGSDEAFAKAKPIIEAMGKRVFHCGGAGAGQSAKICNNMILGISMIAVAEGFVLAEKLGLDKQALFNVVSTSSGQTWAMTNHCPVPGPVPTSAANNGFKPGFAASLMVKDMMLSQEAAAGAGANTPLGSLAAQLYRMHVSSGEGASDYSSVINLIRGEA